MSDRQPSPQRSDRPGRGKPADPAAAWLARCDRGLSAAEQLEFNRWRRDPANARRLAELEGPFAALDRAARLRPADGSRPDEDLLRPKALPHSRRKFWMASGLAAAAAIAILWLPFSGSHRADTTAAGRGIVVRHAPERLALPDGSVVELKPGTRVETDFTGDQRRLRLAAGDAHFTVANDPTRPFIVTAGHVTVRAVGTAFTISASTAAVEVVVTEGRVRVDDAAGHNLIKPVAVTASETVASGAVHHPPALDAGQRVVIPIGPGPLAPVPITAATPEIIDRTTGWRSVWLEFGDMPLAHVVHEFNQHAAEHQQPMLLTADEPTGRVLVSGTFRADGVDAFVRLLCSSFGIDATRQADGRLALHKMN
ncbi:MAG: FecR domain-containing protein [Verrucomicrobia bacterium]|nr:FecR domain-containing protein [Verrucomicrobiota bacterium]